MGKEDIQITKPLNSEVIQVEDNFYSADINQEEEGVVDGVVEEEEVVGAAEEEVEVKEEVLPLTNYEEIIANLKAEKDALIEQNQKPAIDSSFKDDYIKGLVEFYNSHGDIKPYIDALSYDFEKMSPEEIFKYELKKEYPDISSGDFDRLFSHEVSAKFGRISEPEEHEEDYDEAKANVRIAKVKMEAWAKKKRSDLLKDRDTFLKPPPKDDIADLSVVIEKWDKEVRENPVSVKLKSDKTLDFSGFNFEVDDPNAVIGSIVDDNLFFNLFKTGEDKVDFEKFYKVVAVARNMNKFVESLLNHGKALGKAELLRDRKNPASTAVAQSSPAQKNEVINIRRNY